MIRPSKAKSVPFAFSAAGARQVYLAGDFNDWSTSSLPMRQASDGVWRLGIGLNPGRYEFRFYADGAWQHNPDVEQTVVNSLGSQNGVKFVEDENE
jgi:1,4-alpha-glucan branching enzyme